MIDSDGYRYMVCCLDLLFNNDWDRVPYPSLEIAMGVFHEKIKFHDFVALVKLEDQLGDRPEDQLGDQLGDRPEDRKIVAFYARTEADKLKIPVEDQEIDVYFFEAAFDELKIDLEAELKE